MFLYGLFYNQVFDIRIIGMECFISVILIMKHNVMYFKIVLTNLI